MFWSGCQHIMTAHISGNAMLWNPLKSSAQAQLPANTPHTAREELVYAFHSCNAKPIIPIYPKLSKPHQIHRINPSSLPNTTLHAMVQADPWAEAPWSMKHEVGGPQRIHFPSKATKQSKKQGQARRRIWWAQAEQGHCPESPVTYRKCWHWMFACAPCYTKCDGAPWARYIQHLPKVLGWAE